MKIRLFIAATSAALAFAVMPAKAGDWTLMDILIGKRYAGNVTAIQITDGHSNSEWAVPAQVIYPTGNSLAEAQAEVMDDPSLQAALEVRGIAPKNVLWIETALTGGKIIYYR
ncbi:hypothetical protein FE840_006040 [Peteryoungia desertarenae]|uniref:Uncharacterized protein n=1 Tax=Peteryoungia desertarenae TaxID=1813451 RepID=A0ABX6QKP1_9HYPH|nr:hypothetical protein [Peteryoungia desertarenae]QLF69131.1 hypothetical protein FE840_006040 [Peteryoungia desertarenae]